MPFRNLTVDRVIIHEIFKRNDDRSIRPPRYGNSLVALDSAALAFFRERVVAAMGNQSKSIDMSIAASGGNGGAIEIAMNILGSDDAGFIAASRRFADRLADAQTSRGYPGGIVVTFDGNTGHPSIPYVGVIKAETHSGFRRTANLGVEYLQDLFMSPQQKLYKIGIFRFDGARGDDPTNLSDWSATVHDNQLSESNRDGAAHYFYSGFLGCELPESNARLTRAFFESSREFIRLANVPEEQKVDLLTSLYTYLKVDQTPAIEASDFAGRFLDPALRADYIRHVQDSGVPARAILKDISEIGNEMRVRKVTFRGQIQLMAPPSAFEEMISIEEFEPEEGEGHSARWTRVTIRNEIQSQS